MKLKELKDRVEKAKAVIIAMVTDPIMKDSLFYDLKGSITEHLSKRSFYYFSLIPPNVYCDLYIYPDGSFSFVPESNVENTFYFDLNIEQMQLLLDTCCKVRDIMNVER